MAFRIQRVVAEGFRGYARRVDFDCSGDVVILVGSNGWGKTSFFDAITWCLFGRLPRLLGSRDAVGTDLFRNRFFPEVPASVAVSLVDDSEVVVVSRTEDEVRVTLESTELVAGAAEDWVARLFGEVTGDNEAVDDPQTTFLRCHLLSQDQMVHFLRDTNPRERFNALASLLGLDRVREFASHMAGVRKDLAEQSDDARGHESQLLQRLEATRAEIEAANVADGGSTATVEVLANELERVTQDAARLGYVGPSEGASRSADNLVVRSSDMSAWAKEAAAQLRSRVATLRRLADDLPRLVRSQREKQELQAESERLRDSALELRDRITPLRQSEARVAAQLAVVDRNLSALNEAEAALASFLRSSLERLTTDTCPVCGQSIVPDAVREAIADRLQTLPRDLRDLEEQRQELASEERGVADELSEAQRQLAELDERLDQIAANLTHINADWAEFVAELNQLGIGLEKSLAGVLLRERDVALEQAGRLEEIGNDGQTLLKRSRAVVLAAELPRLRQREARVESDLSAARRELDELHGSVALVDGVITASRRSERDLVRGFFNEIEPLMNALYGRLRPHPVLDRLRLDVGSFDERGEVRFIAYSPTAAANVTNIFSSAQLNAVAVCVFLAMNLGVAQSRGMFALLDDPIQNMDDFNVLGLLDLLRGLIGMRQFILSTHDDQIGELLRRKLRPVERGGQTITHRFLAYGSAGPEIETVVDSFAPAHRVLQAVGT